jgi:ribosomal protein L7/L12
MDSITAIWIPLIVVGGIVGLIVLNYIAVTLQERKQGTTIRQPLEIDPIAANDEEVRREIEAGRKINAIKRYRELAGCGLKEAKDAVEYIQVHPDEDFSGKKKKKNELFADMLPDEGVRDMLRNGKRAEAIEIYRQFTGASLVEAKEAIERIEMDLMQPFEDDDSSSDGELRLSNRR